MRKLKKKKLSVIFIFLKVFIATVDAYFPIV